MSSPDLPSSSRLREIVDHLRGAFGIFTRFPVLIPLGLITLFAQLCYSGINNVSLPMLIPRLAILPGEDGWITGAVVSTFLLSETFLRLPFGWLSDRYGRARLIIGALFLSAPTVWLTGRVAPAHWLALFPLRWWDGMMAAALWPSLFALTSDLVPWRWRANAMGLVNMMYMLALIIGSVIAGALIAHTGNPRLFFTFGSTMLMAGGVIALLFFLPRPQLNLPHPQVRLEDAERCVTSVAQHTVLLSITFAQNFAISLLAPFIFRYITEYLHFDKTQLAVLLGIPVIGVGLLALPLSRLGDLLGRLTVVRLAFTLVAVAMWLFSLWHTLPMLAGCTLVIAVGFAMGIPAWLAVISSLSGSRTRGVTMAGYGTVQGAAAVFGPLVAGLIWDRLGHGAIVPASAAALTLATVLVWFAVPNKLDRLPHEM